MDFFKPLSGGVVLYSKGVYVESELFSLEGTIYARHSRGFIKLKENSQTSCAGVYWSSVRTPFAHKYSMGTMVLDGQPDPSVTRLHAKN